MLTKRGLMFRFYKIRKKISTKNKSRHNPEIFYDKLFFSIKEIVKKQEVRLIVEIGTNWGEGSTLAIMQGLKKKRDFKVYLIEINSEKIDYLKNKFGTTKNVTICSGSTITTKEFPSWRQVIKNVKSNNLNRAWSHKKLENLYTEEFNEVSIKELENSAGILTSDPNFKRIRDIVDLLIIDGGEFSARAELNFFVEPKYIVLDDILSYKNFENFNILLRDKNYILIEADFLIRSGFAIFKKQLISEFIN